MKRELQSERQQAALLACNLRQAVTAQQRSEDELKRLKQRSEQELVQVQANKGEIWRTLQVRTSASFIAERSVRSPQKLVISGI